jgi:hypothetical protein
LTKPTHILPLYAECFEWIDPYWPCGKALIESEEQVLVPDYFSADVTTPVHIGINYTTILRPIQTTLHTLARENMTHTFLVDRQRITVIRVVKTLEAVGVLNGSNEAVDVG